MKTTGQFPAMEKRRGKDKIVKNGYVIGEANGEWLTNYAKDNIFKADYDGTSDKGNIAATAAITANPQIKKWLVTGANEEGCVGAGSIEVLL